MHILYDRFYDDEKTLSFILVDLMEKYTGKFFQTLRIKKEDDLSEFLARADFPNHKLIVRSIDKPTKFCKKGIAKTANSDILKV